MKKLFALVVILFLVFSMTSEGFAKGFSSGSRSSGSTYKSSSSTYKSSSSKSTSTKSSSTKSSSTKSSSTKTPTKKVDLTKPKATTTKPVTVKKASTPSFPPPTNKVSGYSYQGRDIFLTAAGTYAIYHAIDSSGDCDYDDIMEGDDDCEEYELSDDEVESIGLQSDDNDDADEMSEAEATLLMTIFLSTIFIVIMIIAGVMIWNRIVEKKRKRRKW